MQVRDRYRLCLYGWLVGWLVGKCRGGPHGYNIVDVGLVGAPKGIGRCNVSRPTNAPPGPQTWWTIEQGRGGRQPGRDRLLPCMRNAQRHRHPQHKAVDRDTPVHHAWFETVPWPHGPTFPTRVLRGTYKEARPAPRRSSRGADALGASVALKSNHLFDSPTWAWLSEVLHPIKLGYHLKYHLPSTSSSVY